MPKQTKPLTNIVGSKSSRQLQIDPKNMVIDIENRTVDVAFSSETPVSRWGDFEVLGHQPGEVDLSRLTNYAAVLWMHDPEDQRGVVVQARIDKDLVGRARLRFSKSDAGETLFQDVIDGIITKISVGYRVLEAKWVEQTESGPDTYRVTKWLPTEISFVSVPADDSVGVGRSDENIDTNKKTDQNYSVNSIIHEGNSRMNEKTLRDGGGNLVRAMVDDKGQILQVLEVIEVAQKQQTNSEAARSGQESERKRVSDLLQLGEVYKNQKLAQRMIQEGKTTEDMSRELLADFASKNNKPIEEQVRSADLGLTDGEVKTYSFVKAVRALMPNATKSDIESAAFEMECSRAAEKQYGKTAQGVLIPNDVLSRALSTTGPAGSGTPIMVDQTTMYGSFIDMLRKKTWLMQKATPLMGLVGNVDIPKGTGDGSAYWVNEGGDAQETNAAIGQIGFSPKTLAAYTDITRKLMMQSSMDVESFVRADLARSVAHAIDIAGISGLGSAGQPLGLKGQSGINTVDFTTASKPTWEEIVAMETAIAADDADVAGMQYIMGATMRGYMKTTKRFSSDATSIMIWEPNNMLNGYGTTVTNQIAATDLFFGNWADYIIAMWGGLDLTVDPYALSKSGGTRIIVFQDVDFNIRHGESFCYGRKP